MPSRRLSLDAIRAELEWVNETPKILTSAAVVMCGAVRKLDISAANVHNQSQQSSGRSGGILPSAVPRVRMACGEGAWIRDSARAEGSGIDLRLRSTFGQLHLRPIDKPAARVNK